MPPSRVVATTCVRRPFAAAVALLALALLSACGSVRTPTPSLSVIQPPTAMKQVSYLGGKLHFDAPENWAIEPGAAPLVVTLGSGPALIAIWRYRRSSLQPVPSSIPAVGQARVALLAAARARDPSFRAISSAPNVWGDVLGVEVDALETIRGQRRRVRSAHLYTDGEEVVVDEYAPVDLFHQVDRTVFSPLLKSVRLVG